jgi:hypothetical protein
MFVGFVAGILSSNFDVGTVFVDAFLKLAHTGLAEAEPIVRVLKEMGDKQQVDFVLSVSADAEELPAFLKEFMI